MAQAKGGRRYQHHRLDGLSCPQSAEIIGYPGGSVGTIEHPAATSSYCCHPKLGHHQLRNNEISLDGTGNTKHPGLSVTNGNLIRPFSRVFSRKKETVTISCRTAVSFRTWINYFRPGENALYAGYDFNIVPATDNSPYFSQFIRWKNLPHLAEYFGNHSIPFFEIGYLLVVFTLVQIAAMSFVFVLLPLFRRGWKGEKQI